MSAQGLPKTITRLDIGSKICCERNGTGGCKFPKFHTIGTNSSISVSLCLGVAGNARMHRQASK